MDDFFSKTSCDRCEKEELKTKIMSWFNEDTICSSCHNEERILRLKLSELGFNDSKFEGINLSIESIRKLIKDSPAS